MGRPDLAPRGVRLDQERRGRDPLGNREVLDRPERAAIDPDEQPWNGFKTKADIPEHRQERTRPREIEK